MGAASAAVQQQQEAESRAAAAPHPVPGLRPFSSTGAPSHRPLPCPVEPTPDHSPPLTPMPDLRVRGYQSRVQPKV